MAKYIDAEIAIEMCDKLIDNAYSCPNLYAIEGVKIVKNLILSDCQTGVPTADVVPIVHAKWSKHCWEEHNYHCSNCNNLASKGAYGYNNDLTPYCPNCGAIMDGGNE